MSNPQNPLNYYRTSSYYFVLGVSNSLEAAEQWAVSATSSSYTNKGVQTITQADPSEFVGALTGESSATSGAFTVLINGATDTKLIIQSVKFQSVLNPNEEHKGESYYHTYNLDGEITIQEPMGISFYNTISDAASALNTTGVGLVFVLKPIFVGHLHSGQSETYGRVKPYIFIITNITSVIDEGGATYSLETMGLVNGAAKLPQYQSVSEGFNMELKAQKPLTDAFTDLKSQLESFAEARKGSMGEKMDIQGMPKDILDSQNPVEYEFHLDDQYQNEKFLVATNPNPRYMEISQDGKYFISQGASAGIEDIIKRIMNSSLAVIEERGVNEDGQAKTDEELSSGGGKASGEKTFIFKVASAVDIQPEKFVVHYYIQRYEVAFESVDDQGVAVQTSSDKKLEFDYIYTGKNIDIKQFDIKMNMGISFFHITSTSNTLANEDVKEPSGVTSANTGGGVIIGADGKKHFSHGAVSTGGANSSPESRNVKNPISTGAYYSMLKKWSAIETIGVTLTIRGNPQLMDETTFVPSDMELDKPQTTSGETQFSEKGALKSPLFVKVNVKFPQDYKNPRSDFETFWYDGDYYVTTIENVFEDGEFYQTLELYALKTDIFNDTKSKDNNPPTTPSVNLASSSSSGNIQGITDAAKDSKESFNLSDALTGNLPSVPSIPNIPGLPNTQQTVERMKALQFQFGVKQMAVQRQINTMSSKIDKAKATSAATGSSFNLESLGITDSGISALKSELKTYQGYMNTVNSKLGEATSTASSLQGVLNQSSTIGMLQAANAEFQIMERLDVSPNNVLNVIKQEAPILSDTWESLESQYEEIKGQYDQIRSQYGELKSLYSELDSMVKSVGNIV